MRARRRTLGVLAVGLVAVVAVLLPQRATALHAAATLQAALLDLAQARPGLALAAIGGLYLVTAGTGLPGHAPLTLTAGALFGAVGGAALALVGTSLGALALFLVVRPHAGRWVERLAHPRAHPRVRDALAGVHATAFSTVLALRLTPVVPSGVATVVAASSTIGVPAFLAATAIGIAPVTTAWAFAGAAVRDGLAARLACEGVDCAAMPIVVDPALAIGLGLLAALALGPFIVKTYRAGRSGAAG